jgi:dihydroorotate dehydrogenase electron transfer subunit
MTILAAPPENIAENHFLLKIKNDAVPEPGQFINIRVSTGTDPLIRRPFSIYDYNDSIMEVVIQKVGKGTELLSTAIPGPMDIIGPLGHGFTLLENSNVLLIGGGVGNAPLLYLARELKRKNNTVTCIYGARSSSFIYGIERFKEHCDSLITMTDDGSAGKKGLVTEPAKELLQEQKFDMIYTCGPTPMMRAIADIATTTGTPIEVSLENYFGCGMGLCAGCTVDTIHGYKRACVDGPVMDGSIIKWESLS